MPSRGRRVSSVYGLNSERPSGFALTGFETEVVGACSMFSHCSRPPPWGGVCREPRRGRDVSQWTANFFRRNRDKERPASKRIGWEKESGVYDIVRGSSLQASGTTDRPSSVVRSDRTKLKLGLPKRRKKELDAPKWNALEEDAC